MCRLPVLINDNLVYLLPLTSFILQLFDDYSSSSDYSSIIMLLVKTSNLVPSTDGSDFESPLCKLRISVS